MHILHNVLYKFPKVLKRRIPLNIKGLFIYSVHTPKSEYSVCKPITFFFADQ